MKNEIIIVYKALSVDKEGRLYSAWARGKSEKRYRLGCWNHQPKWEGAGGLLAFENGISARRFVDQIWLCRSSDGDPYYSPPSTSILFRRFIVVEATAVLTERHPLYLPSDLDKGILKEKRLNGLNGWPHGTVFCSKLKLVGKVPRFNPQRKVPRK